MYEFVKHVDESEKIPNLMGIKFTDETLMDFNAFGNYKNKKYNNFLGRDEILVSGLATGVCDGAVGSTLNFMSFNCQIQAEWDKPTKDMEKLIALQLETVMVIEKWAETVPVLNVQKSILKMTGIDFGPLRLP
jgi:dihydrodipicolinate synthase/N-acetylneuraminate lyase